ncbi:hypothetical protein ABEF92_003305 [Exophiala dermatitidis]|uniref:Uncharacterized protein n=1 Tax=Exophiala dermatitidis (strain ATCC 34100 / CBS 525.76 / NIH/UT8656) TaxID=858893 RepID=H6BVA2_EXODN|nr:uncharacterized protein HMPREF1120_03174 [Exophiala dermatitidis NIH/UT8656]EHY55016.1 hypothetical protein HMPREF1120_03174 [Exophiala dermatitidis NIH/UT8656]
MKKPPVKRPYPAQLEKSQRHLYFQSGEYSKGTTRLKMVQSARQESEIPVVTGIGVCGKVLSALHLLERK